MFVLRRREPDPDAASKDLRNRHREHLLALRRAGVTMRTICRNRLDDPRLNAEVRGILVDAARERQSKARFRRSEEQRKQDRLRMLIELSPFVRNAATVAPTNDSPEERSPAATMVVDPLSVQGAIQSIRQYVFEHFYLREMRDPDLMMRSHRRVHALPRQLAMYMSRQLTGATLQEIGRQFGGMHHSTVLHSINKIERMRRSDDDLGRAIARLMDSLPL
jgi:chromosomal replication initiation ATPase DnaA